MSTFLIRSATSHKSQILRLNDHWLGAQARGSGTATLAQSFFLAAVKYSMDIMSLSVISLLPLLIEISVILFEISYIIK